MEDQVKDPVGFDQTLSDIPSLRPYMAYATDPEYPPVSGWVRWNELNRVHEADNDARFYVVPAKEASDEHVVNNLN